MSRHYSDDLRREAEVRDTDPELWDAVLDYAADHNLDPQQVWEDGYSAAHPDPEECTRAILAYVPDPDADDEGRTLYWGVEPVATCERDGNGQLVWRAEE